jgi:hypothetical protein
MRKQKGERSQKAQLPSVVDILIGNPMERIVQRPPRQRHRPTRLPMESELLNRAPAVYHNFLSTSFLKSVANMFKQNKTKLVENLGARREPANTIQINVSI